MLVRLYVHNFRTLVNFEWSPPSASVLVGRNGTGKTAILEAVWLVRRILCDGARIEEEDYNASRTAWLPQETEQVIEIELRVGARHYSYRLEVGPPERRGATVGTGERSAALAERLMCDGRLLYDSKGGTVRLYGEPPTSAEPRATIPVDRTRSFIAILEERADNRSIIAFRQAIQSIWWLCPEPPRVAGKATLEEAFLQPNLSNFANWYRLRLQEDPDAAERLRADLRRVVDGLDGLRYERVSAEAKDLRVRFVFGSNKHELSWAKLSDGQRLIIALYGVLRLGLTQASLILLDEVENYVSPDEVQPWLRALTAMAEDEGKQVVFISHHPESIDYLAADTLWRVSREPQGGHSRIARLVPDLDAGETAYDLAKRPA